MEGIRYLVNEEQKPVAVQIDLEKYGELWEDFYDVLLAHTRKDEESIPLEDLIEKLKTSGKLDKDV
jgi:hypothetical protein